MHCVVLYNDMMRDKVLLLKILQPDRIPASSADFVVESTFLSVHCWRRAVFPTKTLGARRK